MYKSKIVTTIKYAVFLLFLICVFQEPQEASARTEYIWNLDINVNVEEKIPDDATRAVIDNVFSGKTLYDAGAMIFVGGDGKEYLFICNGFDMNRIEFRRYSKGNYFVSYFPTSRWVYRFDDGEWVFLSSAAAGSTWDTGIPIPWDTGLNLYIFREYTKVNVVFYDTVVWSPTDPTPTPLPTPTSTPTPVPVAGVDANDAGLTEIFGFVMEILNIPISINGYEITWLQIMIYIALATITLSLIFSGVKD